MVWAVRVPLTKKLSAEEAVKVFKAQLAVPCKEAVTPLVTVRDPVISCLLLPYSINFAFSISLIPPANKVIFASPLPEVVPKSK
jgi:hypothetical protein